MKSERKLLWSLMVTILFMWMMAALMSCATPQKKLNKFHKKHPELFIQATDSVLDTTIFVFPGVSVQKDFTLMEIQRNPIIVREKQLSVQISVDSSGNNFKLDAACDTITDTLVKWRSYPVYHVDPCECPKYNWITILFATLALILIYLLIKK